MSDSDEFDKIDQKEDFDEEKPETEEDDVFEGKRNIDYQTKDFPIQVLYLKKKDGDLDPSPKWQRNYVYDKKRASSLIESVLLNVPIPAVYLAEEKDHTLSIIDGQHHKDPYSKGGPTTLENAQLAHRYCNRHKSDKTA